MGFWQFIGQWLLLAITWPATIAGVVAFVFYLLSAGLSARYPKWRDRMKGWRQKALLAVSIVLMFIGLAWAPFRMYDDQQLAMASLQDELGQCKIEHKPVLKFNEPTGLLVSRDSVRQKLCGNITFNITNVGSEPAYQARFTIYCAPLDNLGSVSTCYRKLATMNPIMPSDQKHTSIAMCQDLPGANDYLLIYYQLKYSDAATGGRWDTFDYYWVYDLRVPKLSDASPPQKQLFEPFVKAVYGNTTD